MAVKTRKQQRPAGPEGSESWPLALVHKALRSPPKQSLPVEIIAEGQHILHGVARVQIDVTIAKGAAGTTHEPYKPEWPRVLAALLAWMPETRNLDCAAAANAVAKALAHADAKRMLPMDHLQHIAEAVDCFVREKTDAGEAKPKEGATHIAGKVEIVGWEQPSELKIAN